MKVCNLLIWLCYDTWCRPCKTDQQWSCFIWSKLVSQFCSYRLLVGPQLKAEKDPKMIKRIFWLIY